MLFLSLSDGVAPQWHWQLRVLNTCPCARRGMKSFSSISSFHSHGRGRWIVILKMSKIRPRQGLCKDPKFNPFTHTAYSHLVNIYWFLGTVRDSGGSLVNKVGKVPFYFIFKKYSLTKNFLFSVALCNLQDLSFLTSDQTWALAADAPSPNHGQPENSPKSHFSERDSQWATDKYRVCFRPWWVL